MNATETVRICDAISQFKPAQKFTEDTPAFWAMVLGDVRYEDARQAVINLTTKIRFIGPEDIVAEVKRIRAERLQHSDLVLPDVDPDDVDGWLAARRAGMAAIADDHTTAPLELPEDPAGQRRLAAICAAAFQRPPRPAATDINAVTPKAVAPPQTVSRGEAKRMEVERRRQLAAIKAEFPETA